MGLPKGYLKHMMLKKSPQGNEKRYEFFKNIQKNVGHLPKGVLYEDIDSSFINFANENFTILIDGEKIPVIFLTIQRWNEFKKTWSFSDKDKNIKLPFVTITRKPDIQFGTAHAGNWNIPHNEQYTYVKVPVNKDGREGIDIYKIPQPIPVDITYEVRFFCNKMKDLNKIYLKIHNLFKSRQYYISPNNHFMPVVLENIGDESTISNFEDRRYYVQLFEMKVLGYILDENDFIVEPAVTRGIILNELYTDNDVINVKVDTDKENRTFTYNILFKPLSKNWIEIDPDIDGQVLTVNKISNIYSYDIYLNGVKVTEPFNFTADDIIKINITRDANIESKIIINGIII
jgi:hypothetical protein